MALYGINDHRKRNWLPASCLPVRPGHYEVGHDPRTEPGRRSQMHLIGRTRYFDGAVWLTGMGKHDGPTIFGKHESHQWRGLTKKAYDQAVKRMKTAELVTAINNSF